MSAEWFLCNGTNNKKSFVCFNLMTHDHYGVSSVFGCLVWSSSEVRLPRVDVRWCINPIEHYCLFPLLTQSCYFPAALGRRLIEPRSVFCLFDDNDEHVCSCHVTKQCQYSSHVTLATCFVRQRAHSDTVGHCAGSVSLIDKFAPRLYDIYQGNLLAFCVD